MACVAAPIIGGLDRYPSNDVLKPSIGHTYDTLKREEPVRLFVFEGVVGGAYRLL